MSEPRLAGARHIFLSYSQREAVGLPAASAKSHLLQKFLSNDSTRLIERPCYVIHGTEEIDVVTACKLLHSLPDRPDVLFLTSRYKRERRDNAFVAAICSTPNVALAKYVNPKNENTNLSKEFESSEANFNAENSRPQTIKCPVVAPLRATADLEARILSTYRKAISTSTAVIVTDTQNAAKVFNLTLHEEQMELRKFESLPTPVVRLANSYIATVGDTLVCHQSDYKKGLVTGSAGKIIDIAQPSVHAGDDSANAIIARAFIDTIGEVQLSASDCLKFQLGYAVPVTLDKWSSYNVRIVFLGSGKLPDLSFLKQLMYKTKSLLYLAGYDDNLISTLVMKFHQSLEKE
jgi:hypothetical protein